MSARAQLIDEYVKFRSRKAAAYQDNSLDLYIHYTTVGQSAAPDDVQPGLVIRERTDDEICDRICQVLCDRLKIEPKVLHEGGHVKISNYGAFTAAEVRYLLVALIKTCKNIEVDFNVLKKRFQLTTPESYCMLKAEAILTTQRDAKALFSLCKTDLKSYRIYFGTFTAFPTQSSKKSRFLEN